MLPNSMLNQLSANPKKLFILDGLGALLSAFLLGVVLVQLESYFGIPRNTLYFLAFLPCLFVVYDLFCYWRVEQNIGFFLKVIAVINVLYCCLSIGFAFYHMERITALGWGYILIEILIVLAVAFVEWRVAGDLEP